MHDVINAPTDDIFHRTLGVGALPDCNDAIAWLDVARLTCWTTGDDFADGDDVILLLENSTDAFQRLGDLRVERFGAARVQVIGVRVDRICVGVKERLHDVIAVRVIDRRREVGVTLVESFANVIGFTAGEFKAHPIVADELLPHVVERGLVRRPRCVFAVELKGVLTGERKNILLQQFTRVLGAVERALFVDEVQVKRRLQVAGEDCIVQFGVESGELGEVVGGQIHFVRVNRLQVTLIDVLRHRVIERLRAIGVAIRAERVDEQARGIGLVLGGGHRRGATLLLACDGGGATVLLGLLGQKIIHRLRCCPKHERYGNQGTKNGGLNFHGMWATVKWSHVFNSGENCGTAQEPKVGFRAFRVILFRFLTGRRRRARLCGFSRRVRGPTQKSSHPRFSPFPPPA